MKVFDIFCGTGGFSKGFENSTNTTYDIICGIGLLKTSVETFRLNHENSFSLAMDIRKVSKKDLANTLNIKRGDIDIIVGGPPCQGLSSIRPFRYVNDDDPRNSLFEEYASFVR